MDSLKSSSIMREIQNSVTEPVWSCAFQQMENRLWNTIWVYVCGDSRFDAQDNVQIAAEFDVVMPGVQE